MWFKWVEFTPRLRIWNTFGMGWSVPFFEAGFFMFSWAKFFLKYIVDGENILKILKII